MSYNTDHPICPYGCKDYYSQSDYNLIQGIYNQIQKGEDHKFVLGKHEIICPKCKRKFNLTVEQDYVFSSERKI